MTGTNGDAAAEPASSSRRASRRHPKTCCGDSPWRRATSETAAPGTKVSSRIRALASADHRRRPPAPLIISIRRIGLSVAHRLKRNVKTRHRTILLRIVRLAPQAKSRKVEPGRRLQPKRLTQQSEDTDSDS